MEEKRQQYAKNDKMRADVLEMDATWCMDGEEDDVVDLNIDKLIDVEEEVKVVGKSSRSLTFCDRMKRLSLHHCPLKERMKN